MQCNSFKKAGFVFAVAVAIFTCMISKAAIPDTPQVEVVISNSQ